MRSENKRDGELILVTGGAGFIGSHTVDRLLNDGCRVVVMDDFSTGKRENLAHWSGDARLEVVEACVADGIFAPLADVTQRVGPIDRIVHLAAQTSVVYSMQNPLDDIRINCAGTVHVLEYARSCDVRKVVFSSSSAVYSDDTDFPVDESADLVPISPYGINKLSSEMFLHYYATFHQVRSAALRFFNVYGPRQDPGSPYSGVISIFAERALAGDKLSIFGDGKQTRDFVYVGDVALAIVTACLSNDADDTIANIGAGTEVSINELANLVLRLCGSSSDIEYFAPRPGENLRSVAAIEHARQAIGFRAEVDLEQGLRQTLEWLRGEAVGRRR